MAKNIKTGPGLREQLKEGNVNPYIPQNYTTYTGDISLEKIGQWISYTPTTSTTTVVTSGYASIPIDKWRMELLDFGKVFQVEDNRTPLEKALSNRFKILS